MASFLDKAGLTKFWELIKQYLEENYTRDTVTNNINNILSSVDVNLNKSNLPLNFSEPVVSNNNITFSGKENTRLSTNGYMNNILLELFFDQLFYLFDTTSPNESDFTTSDILLNMGISLDDSSIYLGRVYSKNNRYIHRNIDIYINRRINNHRTSNYLYNISIVPVEEGNLLFSDGLFPLENINNLIEDSVRIQDPLIPRLTLKKLKDNLDDYLPYLENKSTQIKFKIEYANSIRGLLKIYKKSAGSNELELIGRDSTEDTNFSKHITPGEVITTYLEPGDRLYMYGNLLLIKDRNSHICQNIFKLLPTLSNSNPEDKDNKYIINITPCDSLGTPINNINLDQHYLEYGGNMRGMLGYRVYNTEFLQKNPFYIRGVEFINFISNCRYIGEIKVNSSMDQPNDYYSPIIGINEYGIIQNIPIYGNAFTNTGVKKGYISLWLYSEGNSTRETVRMFTNFDNTYYMCRNLTELDVLMDWYDNSKIPDNIITSMLINNVKYTNDNYYLLQELSKSIVWNIKGCRNLKKITLKYKGDRPYSDKIKGLLNKIKDHILSNKNTYRLELDMDTVDAINYTIDIQAI